MIVKTEVFFDSGEETYWKALKRAKENFTGITLDESGVRAVVKIIAGLKERIENGRP